MEELISLLQKIAEENVSIKTPDYFKRVNAENVFNDFKCIFDDEKYIKAMKQLKNYEKPKTPPSLGLLTSDFSSSVATKSNQNDKFQRFEGSGAPFSRNLGRFSVMQRDGNAGLAIRTVASTTLVNSWNERPENDERRLPFFMCSADPMIVLQVMILMQGHGWDFDLALRWALLGNLIITYSQSYNDIYNYPVMAFLGALFVFYAFSNAGLMLLRPSNNIYHNSNPQSAPTVQYDSSSSDDDENANTEDNCHRHFELSKQNLKF